MKKAYSFLMFAFLLAVSASAQNKTAVSSQTTICSLISEGDGGRIAKDAPLILYMKDSMQNRQLEVVFPELMRKKMSYDPYAKLVNQTVCITGKISMYNTAPAIIISNENQIKTTGGEQVNRMSANH
jgi:hypothetical protein